MNAIVIEGWDSPVHPAANLFPMMSDEDIDALAKSIREQGLRQPIILTEDGQLLDGRNRVAACSRAGVPPRHEVYRGNDPVAYVMALNMDRRHLTTGQKAMLALKIEPMYEAEGLARKSAAGRSAAPGKPHKDVADLPHLSQRAPLARDKAGAAVKVSGRAVQQAKRVAEVAPDLAEQVAAGRLTLDKADQQARSMQASRRVESERDVELHALISRVQCGETVVVNMRDDMARALEARGLLTRIDRGTPWGNPFILDEDGDRSQVIEAYRAHYLPHKPSLLRQLPTLRGRALGCWCAPESCHGDVLKEAL